MTDLDIANELVALGVPKEDIVLAFHAPYKKTVYGICDYLMLLGMFDIKTSC